MGDISLGKNSKYGEVQANSLQQGGIKKEQLKNKKLELLFDAADKNKDGVLDKQEAEELFEKLNYENDNVITSKEAKSYLKDANLKDLKKEDLYEFLNELTQASENIKASGYTQDADGNKTISITYNDDTQEVINPDGSRDVTTTKDGATIVTHYNKGSKTPAKETKTTDTETVVTEFEENGNPLTQTITAKDGASVKTITYEDGKPNSAQVKRGATTEYYSIDENGKEVKTSMIENEGIVAKEKRTNYEYGENNTVTENITEPGRTAVRVLQDGVLQSENIKEADRAIERKFNEGELETELITEKDRTIKTTYTQDGTRKVRTELSDKSATEVETRANGDEITIKFNAKGKRLSQTVTKNGQTWDIKYDGKGNTYIVVQNAETPASIAQKFNTSTSTLLAMNHNERDELGNAYFEVGKTIRVPGELNADDGRIKNRRTTQGARQAYVTSGGAAREAAANQEVKDRKEVTWTEKKYDNFEQIARNLFKQEGIENPTDLQLSKRIKDLKHDNPNLVDGQLKGKKITAGVSETRYNQIEEAKRQREAQAAQKQDEIVQKQSARQIVAELKSAADGYNDLGKIQSAIARIDNPTELAEVNRLLAAEGYKADDLYSPIEKFIYEENNHSSAHMYNSTKYMEERVQKWIANGTLKGQDAINAQARMAARVICDGGDGFGTDCKEIKRGIHMIKSPTGNKADAKAVYNQVNKIISKHATFYGIGRPSKDLLDYLDGEMWDGEVKYLNGILAQNNAIQGKEKAKAVHDLVEEAVSGAGTDIEYLQQAIMAIDSPEDMKAVEAKLKEYCQKKGIKPQIKGQSYLQAILYDECDTFCGISADHKEIRKFNEMLIGQGAYTKEEAVKIRAEQAALEVLEGGFGDVQDALVQIKDPAVLAKMNELLKTKGYQGLDGFLNSKFKSSQTNRDLLKAELAANKLLSDNEAASVALRLVQNSDFDTRAKGLAAIRTSAQAQAVDKALKAKGSSLAKVMEKFNAEKSEYQTKAAFWDGLANSLGLGLGGVAEYISDEYRENTDISDNLYVAADKPANISPEKQQAYKMTVDTFEQKLEQMKKDYQNALDSQGVVSGAINAFCSVYNLGTTRDEIEARIEHDTETLRLLKLASEGKLQKIVNGKAVNVSFEEVFAERQSAVVSANGVSSISPLSKAKEPQKVEFNQTNVEKVANQANLMAAMEPAKDMISASWGELNSALASNNNKELSTAIYSSLTQISQMTGKQLSLDAFGYQLKDGVIVDKAGKPVPASELKGVANQLKQGISDISKDLFGSAIPMNANNKSVASLLDKGYESKMEEFKAQYREAFGQDCPDEMIENYLSTINTGLTIVNIGVAIGAVVAAPLTGGGSLAMFVAGAGATLVTQGLEQSTDANGWTNEEWTATATDSAWNGVLAVVGFKVGQMAEAFAKGSATAISQNKWLSKLSSTQAKTVAAKAQNIAAKIESTAGKVGKTAITAQKSKLTAMFPNVSSAKLDKVAVLLARTEAAGFEITSDTVQSLVQTYCVNGEFDPDSFTMDMIISIAANTAGHAFNAVGDIKRSHAGADAHGRVDANDFAEGRSSADASVDNANAGRADAGFKPVHGGASPDANASVEAHRTTVVNKLDEILNSNVIRNYGSDEFKDALAELKQTLEFVDDPAILKYISEMNLNKTENLQEAIDLVTAINTFNGHYAAIKTTHNGKNTWDSYKSLPDSQKREFMKFLKENDLDAYNSLVNGEDVQFSSALIEKFEGQRQQSVFKSDAAMLEKTSELQKYMKQYGNSPMSNHLYNLYLDKMSAAGTPASVIEKCVELNNKFGTKIVFASDIKEASGILNYIDSELSSWQRASNGEAKMPPLFDFNNFNREWYDKTSAHGQSVAGAYSEGTYGGSLAFGQTTEDAVRASLRHEMTHTNDLKTGAGISQELINDIMPKKKAIRHGKEIMVPDMENAKYVDEFRNAGISEEHIPYAYNNTKEFIAVAAEGDMSKYSPEFKNLLVDMGMPDWMFRLDNPTAELPKGTRNLSGSDVNLSRAATEGSKGRSYNAAPEAEKFSALNSKEIKYLPKYTKFPEATTEVLNQLASRIKNGEIPSKEMLDAVIDDVSAKTGVSAVDLNRDFGRGMKVLDSDWQGLESAFKRSEAQNAESASLKRRLNQFREERDLLSDTELQAKQEAELKAQAEAQARAQEEEQAKAKAEAEAQARAEAQAKAEQEARAERQRILEENADKYPEVVNETNFREETTAANLINLMENYDLEMSYADFDSAQIYRKIREAGISNDADMDIAFKMIQERFHSDVIAEGARIKDIKNKYGFFSEDSVTNSDQVIAKIKEKQANGERITDDDIENMLYELEEKDVRDLSKMKNRIFAEPELQAYLNDNLHLNIYNNPKYEGVSEESLNDAVAMLEQVKAEIKNGNSVTLETLQKIYDNHDAIKRAGKGFVSTDALYVLQDAIRNDEKLFAVCKDFVEEFIQGGYQVDDKPAVDEVSASDHNYNQSVRRASGSQDDLSGLVTFDARTPARTSSVGAQGYGNQVSRGQMSPGTEYTINNDMLPILQLSQFEIVDLNNYYKDINSLKEGQQLVIGREGDIQINPADLKVSRKHVVIYKQDGQLKIRDISANGTIVVSDGTGVKVNTLQNGEMVKHRVYELNADKLPEVTLAHTQTLDLNTYKNQIASLQEGQMLTIGRNGDIVFGDNTVSGQHLVIYKSNGQLKIKDISTNGTTITMKSDGLFNRFKKNLKDIVSPSSAEITPQEAAVLNKFRTNPQIAHALAANPAEAKRIAARLNKIMKDPNIVTPELQQAINNGSVNLSAREGTVRCSVDKNVLDDIAKLAVEGDYIKKFKGNVSLQTAFAQTPAGEVANINGRLYVNNGQFMQQVNMSEKTFRKLFPPVKRFSTHQGAVGTCYLVSSLERLYASPAGRAKIYSMIGEDANGIYTMTYNGGGKKDYFRRWDRFHKHIADETGLAYIEQGYCKNSRTSALNFNPRETHIMEINAGGWSKQAMEGLIGETPYVAYSKQDMANWIRNYANRDGAILNCATGGAHNMNDTNSLSQEYNLFAHHEYSVKGYDSATDCVLVSNPWHSGLTVKIPVNEFVRYFNEVSMVNL